MDTISKTAEAIVEKLLELNNDEFHIIKHGDFDCIQSEFTDAIESLQDLSYIELENSGFSQSFFDEGEAPPVDYKSEYSVKLIKPIES